MVAPLRHRFLTEVARGARTFVEGWWPEMKAWCFRGCFPFRIVDSHLDSVLVRSYGRLHPFLAENLLSKKVEFHRMST